MPLRRLRKAGREGRPGDGRAVPLAQPGGTGRAAATSLERVGHGFSE